MVLRFTLDIVRKLYTIKFYRLGDSDDNVVCPLTMKIFGHIIFNNSQRERHGHATPKDISRNKLEKVTDDD